MLVRPAKGEPMQDFVAKGQTGPFPGRSSTPCLQAECTFEQTNRDKRPDMAESATFSVYF